MNDTQKRDVLDALRGLLKHRTEDLGCYEFVLEAWIESAADEIEQLRNERRWIPVTERLPDIDANVLAAFSEDGKVRVCEVLFADFSDEDEPPKPEWCGDYGRIAHEDVSHWMPLPAPPADGK